MIADDQKLFAGSMKIVLEGHARGEMEVVGIAYDGAEAVKLVDESGADVVLMDVRMPIMDGVEATRRIHADHPEVRIMILTTFDDDDYVHDALAAGAVGYVLKEIQPEDLVVAVKAVCSGSYLISPSVGFKLVSRVNPDPREDRKAEVDRLQQRFKNLSRREAQVLDLILQSFDNHEIAARLHIAEQTAKNYASMIYAKLGVADRIHAIRLASGEDG